MLNFNWIKEKVLETSNRHLKFAIEQIYNTSYEDVFECWNRWMEKEWKECYYPPFDLPAEREVWLEKGVIYEKYQFDKTDPPFGFEHAFPLDMLVKMYGYEKKYFHIERN